MAKRKITKGMGLYHGASLSYKELAEMAGLKPKTVFNRISQGLTDDALIAPPEPWAQTLKKASRASIEAKKRGSEERRMQIDLQKRRRASLKPGYVCDLPLPIGSQQKLSG